MCKHSITDFDPKHDPTGTNWRPTFPLPTPQQPPPTIFDYLEQPTPRPQPPPLLYYSPQPTPQPPQQSFGYSQQPTQQQPPPSYVNPQQPGFSFPQQPGFSFPSQASTPSGPMASTSMSDDNLFKYMFPTDPRHNYDVIGVYTTGRSTKPAKEFLPDIYQKAGLSFCCHSCQEPIPIITNIPGLYSLIGDHQLPTVLLNQLHPFNRYKGTLGKLWYTLQRIQGCCQSLYIFRVENAWFQTNNYQLARHLSYTEPIAVIYGICEDQFLYPHCQTCSNTQGRLLW